MMAGKYAKDTIVSPEKTMQEILATLKRYDALKFIVGEIDNCIAVAFDMCDRRVQFKVPLPTKDSSESRNLGGGPHGNKGAFNVNKFEQATAQRWRALLLVIKAKLESMESGIETFEEAFLSQLVLPDGRNMYQWAKPQIEQAYLTGAMPPLLGSGS